MPSKSELIAVAFDDSYTAEEVRLKLLKMQEEHLISLEDAVVAVRNEDGKVRLNQSLNLTAAGAVGGGFWGTLVGLIFLSPLLGMAAGAAAGAVSGALSDVGINDEFMKKLASNLKPNSSALFLLVRDATLDKVMGKLQPFEGTLLHTSLSHADEQKLKQAMTAESIG